MTQLHPPLSVITASYEGWLVPRVDDFPPSGFAPSEASDKISDRRTDPESEISREGSTPEDQAPPSWLKDLIHRQVQARPEQRSASTGDLVLFSLPAAGSMPDDGLPLLALLDEERGGYWSGWLVGAHPDYAGSQDLIIDRDLLEDARDPAPLAAMVQTWNRIRLPIVSTVPVLHRLTDSAMTIVRSLALAGLDMDNAPAPGQMMTRTIEGRRVVTGTSYGKHDPRDGYLLLSRELARLLSEPRLERDERELGDGQAGD